jgi:trehalose-6-phosphate synthase
MTGRPQATDLPVVLLSHRGPVSFERDEEGARTASRGAGGLVTALTGLVSDLPDAVWVCAADSDEDAAVAAGGWHPGGPQHQPQPPRRADHAPPHEAVADFLRSDMDALFLGSLLFEQPTPA